MEDSQHKFMLCHLFSMCCKHSANFSKKFMFFIHHPPTNYSCGQTQRKLQSKVDVDITPKIRIFIIHPNKTWNDNENCFVKNPKKRLTTNGKS